jgi:hypothetical protein
MEEIRQLYQEFKFGFEAELCVSDVSKNEGDDTPLFQRMATKFNRKPICEENTISWDYTDKPFEKEAMDYSKWNITSDSTVDCPSKDRSDEFPELKTEYCMISGRKDSCPEEIEYYRDIEIVSPILIPSKFTDMYKVWMACILSSNLTYLINESQGLHVHLSHPRLDMNRFLKLWYALEEVIKNILPSYRRINLGSMAKDVRALCVLDRNKRISINPDVQLLKFHAVNTSYYKPDSCRLEIRVYPGTADFLEIYSWVNFCLLFACKSILTSEEELNRVLDMSYRDKVEYLFNQVIPDKRIAGYFSVKYNINKKENIPKYDYKDRKIKIIESIKTSPTLTQEILENQAIPV